MLSHIDIYSHYHLEFLADNTFPKKTSFGFSPSTFSKLHLMDKTSKNQANITTLNHLKVGDKAIVNIVSNKNNEFNAGMTDISRRLKELGFVQGEELAILHKGYFGGEPIAVRIGQSTFALRNFEAALIGVTKLG